MTLEGDFLDLMPDTVTIEPYAGESDLRGDRTYGTAYQVRCYVAARRRQVLTKEGQTVVSSVQVYLYSQTTAGTTTPTVSERDRLTLPSRFVPQKPVIISIDRYSDDHGDYAQCIYT